MVGEYSIVRWLFLRGLGVIYLIAFASFAVQSTPLIGKRGLLPAKDFLLSAYRLFGRKAYLYYPTFAWINSSDGSIKFLCLAGIFLAILLILGLQTTPVLLFLWALYLSLVGIGQVFLSFQWDILLLEVGFLSIFLVPPSLLPSQALGPPSPIVIFLFKLLLFRLILMSGIVKLASGDLTWRNLTALAFHYQTQPLPTPLAWYFFKLPLWFQKVSTLFALLTELLIPFFYFGPRTVRGMAASATILLQLLISLTGNYAFFNLLTMLLTIFLFNDAFFSRILPEWAIQLANRTSSEQEATSFSWGNPVLIPLAILLVLLGAIYLLSPLIKNTGFYKKLNPALQVIAPFRIVNPYGLFSVMTTVRPEIILEGSVDGISWLPYEFRYKPGDLGRALPVVEPHQPRLDWQMWFAALGSYQDNRWLLTLVTRLLQGEPQANRFFSANPFPDKPPKYIRALLYDYRFTTFKERAQTGTWWQRELLGQYLPTIALTDR